MKTFKKVLLSLATICLLITTTSLSNEAEVSNSTSISVTPLDDSYNAFNPGEN